MVSADENLSDLVQKSQIVKNFAHDFGQESSFKTTVLSQPEWLLDSQTEMIDHQFHSDTSFGRVKTEVLSS